MFKEPKASESMIPPLTMLCTDACQQEGLGRFLRRPTVHLHGVSYPMRQPRSTRSLMVMPTMLPASGDLMARLNQFLAFEAELWSIAREQGFDGTVPYPVRYYAAAYLWSPLIAGHACLRCGNLISYKKAGRPESAQHRVRRVSPIRDQGVASPRPYARIKGEVVAHVSATAMRLPFRRSWSGALLPRT